MRRSPEAASHCKHQRCCPSLYSANTALALFEMFLCCPQAASFLTSRKILSASQTDGGFLVGHSIDPYLSGSPPICSSPHDIERIAQSDAAYGVLPCTLLLALKQVLMS